MMTSKSNTTLFGDIFILIAMAECAKQLLNKQKLLIHPDQLNGLNSIP